MKFLLSFALATASLFNGVSGLNGSVKGKAPSSRRTFFDQATTSFGLVASATSVGWLGNTKGIEHGQDCTCGNCVIPRIGPSPASAYERRDVGGENRSAETAALNIQV